MNLRILFYKLLNKVVRADITRVLWFNISEHNGAPAGATHSATHSSYCDCRTLNLADLKTLAVDPEFSITESFLKDFTSGHMTGVVAYVGQRPAGVLFLAHQHVSARHNSGGSAFRGIAVSLPNGVCFLFKVYVKASQRGRAINKAMLNFAINSAPSESLLAIVTTTDWTNYAFLSSVESLGFQRYGMASEFVIGSKHKYQLPKALDPQSGQTMPQSSHADCVNFFVEQNK